MTGLLIFALVYLFVVCTLNDFIFGELTGRLLFSFIIVTGVMTTFKQRWVHFFVLAAALASLAINWAEELHPGGSLTIMNAGLSLVYLGLLLVILLLQVYRSGPVTAHRIRGAIVVYLLMGAMWGVLYFLVALTIPNSFRLAEEVGSLLGLQRLLTYFSFVTLTTTGFGDIVPIHPLARTLAMFEALAGQLYLVITMARLVSLGILDRQQTYSPKSEND